MQCSLLQVRIIRAIGLIAAVAVLNFTLMHMVPGDIVQTIVGEMGGATEATIKTLRETYGLDRPFHEQLLVYVGHVLTGNLGISAYYNKPVLGLILERVPATALLVTTARWSRPLRWARHSAVISARFPRSWFTAAINIIAESSEPRRLCSGPA